MSATNALLFAPFIALIVWFYVNFGLYVEVTYWQTLLALLVARAVAEYLTTSREADVAVTLVNEKEDVN